jgi:regulator of sigma E protease
MAWNIAKLVILLGLIILIHEFGHFLAARLSGVRVLKFSIGFPPKIFGFTRGDTEYVVGATPLGGYVKLAGEDWDTGVELKPDDLMAKPFWVRIILYASGVFMNAVLAWLIFFGLFLHGIEFNRFPSKVVVNPGSVAAKAGLQTGDVIVKAGGERVRDWKDLEGPFEKAGKKGKVEVEAKRGSAVVKAVLPAAEDPGMEPFVEPIIGDTEPFQPARKAGLMAGDRVVSVNGKTIRIWAEMSKIVSAAKEGSTLHVRVLRDGKKMDFSVMPRYDAGMKRALIGISAKSSSVGTEKWGVFDSASMSTRAIWLLSSEIVSSVGRVITGKSKFKDVLGGPVLIGRVGYEKARQSMAELLHFIAALSVSLMVVNLLPIPAVDGGMIVMALLEGIRGRRFTAKTYQNFVTVGFAFLMAVFLLATYHDILR